MVGAEGRLLEGLRQGFPWSGHVAIFCSSATEVRTALRDGRFCYVMLAPAGSIFRGPKGEELFDELRLLRTTMVMIARAEDDEPRGLLDLARKKLDAAGMRDHATCVRPPEPPSIPEPSGSAPGASRSIVIRSTGEQAKKRTILFFNENPIALSNSELRALLNLLHRHFETPRRWNELHQLHVKSWSTLSKLQKVMRPALPSDYLLIRTNHSKFRLDPDARIDTDLAVLADHADDEVSQSMRETFRRWIR